MIVSVISPDKIAVSMFKSFFEKEYIKNSKVKLLLLNSSLSEEMNTKYIDSFVSKLGEKESMLVLLKTRSTEKVDTDKCVKIGKLKEVSDLILSFEVYAVTPYVLKDSINESEKLLPLWKEFVGRIEKS